LGTVPRVTIVVKATVTTVGVSIRVYIPGIHPRIGQQRVEKVNSITRMSKRTVGSVEVVVNEDTGVGVELDMRVET
jgi:hypothetical protein